MNICRLLEHYLNCSVILGLSYIYIFWCFNFNWFFDNYNFIVAVEICDILGKLTYFAPKSTNQNYD